MVIKRKNPPSSYWKGTFLEICDADLWSQIASVLQEGNSADSRRIAQAVCHAVGPTARMSLLLSAYAKTSLLTLSIGLQFSPARQPGFVYTNPASEISFGYGERGCFLSIVVRRRGREHRASTQRDEYQVQIMCLGRWDLFSMQGCIRGGRILNFSKYASKHDKCRAAFCWVFRMMENHRLCMTTGKSGLGLLPVVVHHRLFRVVSDEHDKFQTQTHLRCIMKISAEGGVQMDGQQYSYQM